MELGDAITCRVLPVGDVELRDADAVMLGGVVPPALSKVIVTVKLAVPTFPAASVAVQVTVVLPTGKLEPEGGEQVGPEVTPTSSDAVTDRKSVV